MKLRSYHTDSVETAIRMAGIELGDEAVFLGSTRAADAGPYEVTFALVDTHEHATESTENAGSAAADTAGEGHWRKFVPAGMEAESMDADEEHAAFETIQARSEKGAALVSPLADSTLRPEAIQSRPLGLTPAPTRLWKGRQEKERQLSRSVEELSQSVGELREWLRGQRPRDETVFLANSELQDDPLRAALYAELTRQGVRSNLALELLTGPTFDDSRLIDIDGAPRLIEEWLKRICPLDASLGVSGGGLKIVALVGPPGVGKTSTIAKLAVRYGLSCGSSLEFVAADPLRVGVAEPLEAYARLFGSRLTQLTETESLGAVLDEIRERTASADRSLVFIDTPGYGRSEWGHAERLAGSVTATPDIDVHLVLSLNTKPCDIRRTIERYGIFEPSKLLFTKLDETETFGVALNEAMRTRWPLSFFANGTRVPEDLAPVNASVLSRLLLRRNPMAAE